MVALIEWHEKRSHDILMAIIEKNNFAKRVQTLKVYSPGSKDTDALVFQMGLLNLALPQMIRLRVLKCYGLLMPLRTTISKLPETVPHLQRLRLGDRANRRDIPGPGDIRLHRLSHLNQLTLCEGWQDHLSLTDLPKDLEASSIKRLHITCGRIATDVLARCTTPAFISMLTHLSLRTPDTSESAIDIALRYGVNLQSLRFQGYLGSPKSQHFRRYAHALPSLTEFRIFLHGHSTQSCTDADFFPAVCDFLRPKAAQLVHLELRAPELKSEQDKLGFNGGKECWALFKSVSRSGAAELFPKLESLSMTLPDGKKSFSLHCSKLIPKGVTRLSLSGYQLVDSSVKNVFRVSHAKSGPSWPPNLRLVCLIASPSMDSLNDITLAQMVAECIATVRVVSLLSDYCKNRGFWSANQTVGEGNTGNSPETGPLLVSCKQWDSREATYIRAEMLDRHDCEDSWFEDC